MHTREPLDGLSRDNAYTERAGFEPATHLSARTRFPVALLRPLGHLSEGAQRIGLRRPAVLHSLVSRNLVVSKDKRSWLAATRQIVERVVRALLRLRPDALAIE